MIVQVEYRKIFFMLSAANYANPKWNAGMME